MNHTAERRITELLSEIHLAVKEFLEITSQHKIQNGMLFIEGLDNHFARMTFPSCSSAHLHHQLETTFVGAKVREAKQLVSAQDSNKTHAVEIQTLGDHLGSH